MLFKKAPEVGEFLKEVLEYAQDIRVISDRPNQMGKNNYEGFVAHRHDQSVISLMSKKHGIKRFRDPSQYGMMNHYEAEVEKRSDYPQIIDSHRLNVGSMWELKWRRTKFMQFIRKFQIKMKNKFNTKI